MVRPATSRSAGCSWRLVPGVLDWLRADDLLPLLRTGRLQTTTRVVRRIFALRRSTPHVPLMIPVILLGGILTGQFTPTEAGVVAALYCVVIIPPLNSQPSTQPSLRFLPGGADFLLAPDHYWRGLCLRLAVRLFARADRHLGVDHQAAGNDPTMIMLLMVLLFTIVGDFIDAVPAIIIFMPLMNDADHRTPISIRCIWAWCLSRHLRSD